MKKDRQVKIAELIAACPIETQEDLQAALKKAGYDVTQATVSRDIKEMRIVKMLDVNGVYRYALHGNSSSKLFKYHEIFSNSVISVCYAMNDVVIKCHPGMAQGACASLDVMNFPGVLGTIAGDDTVLVITSSEKDAGELCTSLMEIL